MKLGQDRGRSRQQTSSESIIKLTGSYSVVEKYCVRVIFHDQEEKIIIIRYCYCIGSIYKLRLGKSQRNPKWIHDETNGVDGATDIIFTQMPKPKSVTRHVTTVTINVSSQKRSINFLKYYYYLYLGVFNATNATALVVLLCNELTRFFYYFFFLRTYEYSVYIKKKKNPILSLLHQKYTHHTLGGVSHILLLL